METEQSAVFKNTNSKSFFKPINDEEKKQQVEDFNSLVQPVMDYLRASHDNSLKMVITAHKAELLSMEIKHEDPN